MTVRAVAAGLLGAIGLVGTGCGGDSSKLLRDADAAGLKSTLEEVRQAVDERQPSVCTARLRELRSQVGNLPSTVDRELRVRLREEIVDKLTPAVQDECDDPKTETQPTVTEPAPTGPTGPATEDPPPETETTETTPPPTETQPPVTPDPDTTTPTEPPPVDPTRDPGGFGPQAEEAP